MLKEINYRNPGVDYLPDKGRHALMGVALKKKRAEAERQRKLNERSRYI